MKQSLHYIYYIAPVALSLCLLGISGTLAVALVAWLRK